VLVGASISQLCASGRWEIFRFLSFVSLRGIGYACVLMACSASPKPIGTVNLMALLAPPEFAAFAAFSFVRLSMHWHVRAFAYSATLYAFFCVCQGRHLIYGGSYVVE
jgi:hypothetical protein